MVGQKDEYPSVMTPLENSFKEGSHSPNVCLRRAQLELEVAALNTDSAAWDKLRTRAIIFSKPLAPPLAHACNDKTTPSMTTSKDRVYESTCAE